MADVSQITAQTLKRIHEIDVSEEVDAIYVQRGTVLERREEPHARPWRTAADWSIEVELWQGHVESDGAAFGAFDGERFLGFSVLRSRLDDKTAQLSGLYVDRAWRRHGLGRALVSRVVESARKGGATRLYVSSSRYEAAVNFYLNFGFEPLGIPDPELLRLEPHDIHMALSV
jgi:ribosomal protein S18 acetylase RimI-like enzyme